MAQHEPAPGRLRVSQELLSNHPSMKLGGESWYFFGITSFSLIAGLRNRA